MADIKEFDVQVFTADVALVTTAETVVATSGVVPVPGDTCLVRIRAWAQLTTGTNTTAVTPRIRRGTTAAGTLVGEANAEQVKAAAGSTEPFEITVIEERANVGSVQYCLTLTQAGASANGAALQGAIEVMIL